MPSYVVAGASRGIGLAFLRQLSAKPENVVIGLVRNKDTAKGAVALEQAQSNTHLLVADITDFQALKNAAQEVSRIVGGKLDYLINNAAFMDDQHNYRTIDDYPEEILEADILKSVKTNVIGVIHTINAFLPLLTAAAANSVVKVITLSSGMADTDFVIDNGVTMAVPYAISKAALNMAIAKYASRYKGGNIGFLAINPGFVDTSTRPPTPEELANVKVMMQAFKRANPNWDGIPLTPEVSVKMMWNVIDNWDINDNGAFLSQHGDRQWL